MLRRSGRVERENVNHPGQVKLVPADMYQAMTRAFLKILPKRSPGLTPAEIQEVCSPTCPRSCFRKELRPAGGPRPFSLTWRRKV